jgi:hypothetical protein
MDLAAHAIWERNMSQHETKEGTDCLFARQGMSLINVRFFRGSNDVISEEEFRRELCAAADRRRSGEVKPVATAPRCQKEPIDLRAFVGE